MTEPVPGIRPTSNQMEWRTVRGEGGGVWGGAGLGITLQAGGAGLSLLCPTTTQKITQIFQIRVKAPQIKI